MVTAPAGVADSEHPKSDAADRPRPSTDVALLQVVHLVLDQAWSPRVAANRLLKQVDGDRIVLRHARARVLRAERPNGPPRSPNEHWSRSISPSARRDGHDQTQHVRPRSLLSARPLTGPGPTAGDARPTPSGFGSQPEPDLLEPQIPLHVLNGGDCRVVR